MRILFLGDIVGQPGVAIVKKAVPLLRERERLDVVIANAENAAGGSGLTPSLYRQLRAAGVDAITLGDHIYKKFEISEVLEAPSEPVCKPANYPPTAPGRDHILFTVAGTRIAVISLLGRTFLRPVDCPFAAVDRVLAAIAGKADVILVDMHAEATADKYLMAHHLTGRVAAVLGTHTHVATADEQIFAGGTAFQCDVGMTGPHAGILGREVDRVLTTAISFVPTSFDVAKDDVRLSGAIVEVDPATGKASAIQRVMWREADLAGWK